MVLYVYGPGGGGIFSFLWPISVSRASKGYKHKLLVDRQYFRSITPGIENQLLLQIEIMNEDFL